MVRKAVSQTQNPEGLPASSQLTSLKHSHCVPSPFSRQAHVSEWLPDHSRKSNSPQLLSLFWASPPKSQQVLQLLAAATRGQTDIWLYFKSLKRPHTGEFCFKAVSFPPHSFHPDGSKAERLSNLPVLIFHHLHSLKLENPQQFKRKTGHPISLLAL